jgi:hypothetical protein
LRGALEEIRRGGAELTVIGNGPPHFVEAFKKELNFDGPIYTDPSLQTYRAAEMKRGLLRAFSPASAPKAIRALAAGFRQSRQRGDAWQLGGVVVIGVSVRQRASRRSCAAGRGAARGSGLTLICTARPGVSRRTAGDDSAP